MSLVCPHYIYSSSLYNLNQIISLMQEIRNIQKAFDVFFSEHERAFKINLT